MFAANCWQPCVPSRYATFSCAIAVLIKIEGVDLQMLVEAHPCSKAILQSGAWLCRQSLGGLFGHAHCPIWAVGGKALR